MAWDRRQESSTLGRKVSASKDPSHKNRSRIRRTSVWTSARKLIDACTSFPTERCSRPLTPASQIETRNPAQIETFSIRQRRCHGSRQLLHPDRIGRVTVRQAKADSVERKGGTAVG